MPTSRSPKQGIEPAAAPRSRFLIPLAVIAVVAVVAVAVCALPASLITKALPASVDAQDFSGSVWHGSAGRITLQGRDVGGAEWRLHPMALIHARISADVHWVKGGFVADGTVEADARGMTVRAAQGGGPLEDLGDLGVAPGWRGATTFKFTEFKMSFTPSAATLTSVIGDVAVADLSSAQVADGVDLGGYVLHMADGAITPDTDAAGELADTGGPLDLKATIHYSVNEHTGIFSGTVRERPEASPALRAELSNFSLLHPRNAAGRIPVELEFTL